MNERFESAYRVTEEKIGHLTRAMPPLSPALMLFLRTHTGESVAYHELACAIVAAAEGAREEEILNLLHDVPFRPEAGLLSGGLDSPDSYEWRLYFALMREAKTIAAGIGAEMAIVSDVEQGLYQWFEVSNPIPPGRQIREAFMKPSTLIREFARREGIDFIDSPRPHIRARNDAHATVKGNENMAANIYEYLMAHHGEELEAHSMVRQARPQG